MDTRKLLLALALLCAGGLAACEKESPLEEAADEVSDAAKDAKDKLD